MIFGVASAAALASPLGGLIAVWARPSSLLLSIAVGFAAGVLLGTFSIDERSRAAAASRYSPAGRARRN